MAEFGELLTELRQDFGMTQEQLAERLFVSKGTISNYENGVHYPDIEKLTHLAELFSVTTDYLLGRCNSRLPVDVLDEVILADKTTSEFITEIRNLSRSRQQALVTILRDMSLGMYIDSHN